VVIFDVVIVAPLPAGVIRVSNQATISGSNFTGIQSDDPAASGASDPTITQIGRFSVSLPLIRSQSYPDLIVERITFGSTVEVVIRNQGTAAAALPFWVDLYVNPRTAPTHVNQTWQSLATYGMVWGVTAPIPVGGTVTLRRGDVYYRSDLSSLPGTISAGTPIYAQVDSASAGSSNGGIAEIHEVQGGAYNNILGPVLATGGALASIRTTSATPDGEMPQR
jgi:hypothetical protein